LLIVVARVLALTGSFTRMLADTKAEPVAAPPERHTGVACPDTWYAATHVHRM
jgi:hypothetical protein